MLKIARKFLGAGSFLGSFNYLIQPYNLIQYFSFFDSARPTLTNSRHAIAHVTWSGLENFVRTITYVEKKFKKFTALNKIVIYPKLWSFLTIEIRILIRSKEL